MVYHMHSDSNYTRNNSRILCCLVTWDQDPNLAAQFAMLIGDGVATDSGDSEVGCPSESHFLGHLETEEVFQIVNPDSHTATQAAATWLALSGSLSEEARCLLGGLIGL